MNKDQFNYLVSNYTSLSQEETEELTVLQKEFPYSQVVHSIVARGSQQNNLPGKDGFLHLSAIYATDRSVLKNVMTAPIKRREEKKIAPRVEAVPENIATAAVATPAQTDLTGEALYDEVKHDLERLNELRHTFEATVEEIERNSAKPKKIDALAEEESVNESIIEEIKTNKQKIVPEGNKQIEQIQIIDKFIKTQPTISRNKQPSPPAPVADPDLAEDSVLFGENIVSETLVEILLKQGKKDKAIEVLKKLIWKFPQKKAYFAAQIEELKK